MTFGEQTVNEMAFLFLQAVTDTPQDLGVLRLASLGQMLKGRLKGKSPDQAAAKPDDEPAKPETKTGD